jgi:predicted metal-dependent phosphoesterase TrpH
MIDLHSHTTASDGEHSPTSLIGLAAAAGVTHLSITDHDTLAGLPEAQAAADAQGVTLIPGIEVSAFVHGRKEIHVLGHFVDTADATLGRYADRLRVERRERMEQMVEKVKGLGFPVTMEAVLRIADGANLGRPHLALWFVHQGFCASPKEAFDRFLGDGRAAWVDRGKLSAEDAIAMIRGAGGTATLAHPGVSKMERGEIALLARAGLSGLEALHADHNPSVRQKYVGIAQALDLVPTGGSDFHGKTLTPDRALGCSVTPAENLERLRGRAKVL